MILVIGTGRCGSSTVARLLHERFKVCMGHLFPDPDENNPKGYYEDLEFRNVNLRFMNEGSPLPAYLQWMRAYMERRSLAGTEWGVKDDILAFAGPLWLAWRPEGRVIWCQRSIEQVAASMARIKPDLGDMEKWLCEVQFRVGMMERWAGGLDNVLHIDFSEQRTDDDVAKQLEGWL